VRMEATAEVPVQVREKEKISASFIPGGHLSTSLSNFLRNNTVGRLLEWTDKHNVILQVTNTATLGEVMEKLELHHCLSLLVFDPTLDIRETEEHTNLVGEIDTLCIARALLSFLRKNPEDSMKDLTQKKAKKLLSKNASFANEPVEKWMNQPYKISNGASLLELVEYFTEGSNRVAVVDQYRCTPLGVLSQYDLNKFFVAFGSLFPEVQNAIVADIPQKFPHELVKVTDTDKVSFALAMMVDNHVSGLPVCNVESGALIANFSPSDLLHLEAWQLTSLALPLSHYLQDCSNRCNRCPLTCITVVPEDRLLFAMMSLAHFGIHRLYIIDKAQYSSFLPIGAVTYTDIFALLIRLHKKALSHSA